MQIGIEKENLVFDENLQPVHKKAGEMNKGIELDFADHQIEFISDPFDTNEEVIDQVEGFMQDAEFKGQYFWPLSMPKTKQENFTIKGTRTLVEQNYRQLLLDRYGIEKMLVSGIHINYSNCHEGDNCNHQEHYFELLKRVYVFGPILSQFVSYTPYDSKSNNGRLQQIGRRFGQENLISLRNSDEFGYGNEHKLDLDYTSYEAYRNSINKMIEQGHIDSEKELYAKVRHKGSYIELRFIDINPYERVGISKDMLDFISAALETIRTSELVEFNQKMNIHNFDLVATKGLNHQIEMTINGKTQSLEAHTIDLFAEIKAKIKLNAEQLSKLEQLETNYLNNNLSLNQMIAEYEANDYTNDEFGLRHLKHQTEYKRLLSELKMELSSKILISEAQKQGVNVNIIDEETNFIELSNKQKSELVVQATKTNLDKYANILAMENKYVTKYLLERENIQVPTGMKLTKLADVDYHLFTKKMVVKPLDTNFGQGITILEANATKADVDKAVLFALDFSHTVIIEEFAEGTEYRFLVIDGQTRSIVKRVAANVIGDGVHTIKELLCFKNSNTIRNKGYITPVEYLQIGEFETKYLANQNLKWNSIPEHGEQVFLRENSNVSTGGDSYELFDQIPEYFKIEAAKAAAALQVKICGIDMIINDLNEKEYRIIEANFNPAIQMHTYPFEGTGRNVAKDLLVALELIK